MRSEQEVNAAIDRYADTVRRLCMLHLKNYADTEDIFQTVFLKYALHTAPFADGEHEKAWLIRVTLNACKDLLKSVFRSRTVALEAAANLPPRSPRRTRKCWRPSWPCRKSTEMWFTSTTTRGTPPQRSRGCSTET